MAKRHKDWATARSHTSPAYVQHHAKFTLDQRNWTPLWQMRRDALGRFSLAQQLLRVSLQALMRIQECPR